MSVEIERLQKQIALAHDRIDSLSNENLAFRLLIYALISSHENPSELIAHIETEKERFLATGVYKTISDEALSYLQVHAARAISSLQRQQRDE